MTLKVSDAICGKRICEKYFCESERESGRRTQRNNSTYTGAGVLARTFRLARRQRPTRGDVLRAAPLGGVLVVRVRRHPLCPQFTRCLWRCIWVIVHAPHTWNDRHEDDHHDPPFPTPAHHLPNRTTRASKAHRAASPPNAKDPNEGAHHNIHEHQLLIRTTRNSTMIHQFEYKSINIEQSM